MRKFFMASAEDDRMLFEASNLNAAKKIFAEIVGEVPDGFVKWTELNELPEDFEEEDVISEF